MQHELQVPAGALKDGGAASAGTVQSRHDVLLPVRTRAGPRPRLRGHAVHDIVRASRRGARHLVQDDAVGRSAVPAPALAGLEDQETIGVGGRRIVDPQGGVRTILVLSGRQGVLLAHLRVLVGEPAGTLLGKGGHVHRVGGGRVAPPGAGTHQAPVAHLPELPPRLLIVVAVADAVPLAVQEVPAVQTVADLVDPDAQPILLGHHDQCARVHGGGALRRADADLMPPAVGGHDGERGKACRAATRRLLGRPGIHHYDAAQFQFLARRAGLIRFLQGGDSEILLPAGIVCHLATHVVPVL